MTDLRLTQPPAGTRSLRRGRPRYGELAVKGLLLLAALVSVATTVGIVISLLPPTINFFKRVGFGEFFGGTKWTALFSNPSYGILPLLTATLLITAIALLVAIPVGIGSAIYLSEYARPRVRAVLKPTLEVLAGIPTVVYGFFGLFFLTPLLREHWPLPGEAPEFQNALVAGLVMGVMVIPTIASLAEDAMSAVPHALRDGAYALGSGRRTVALRVVVPAALSGIVAACVLGVSRAIGETMIVAIISGTQSTKVSLNPLEPMQTMTGFIAQAGSGDVATSSFEYKTIFAVGAVLFVLTFVMNMISMRLVRKYREVYE
ncbi:phosphate ABC transporter permease subunit PstC [Streptomyces polyrhachis]|uniref:Phosphate transport system permease protein n=1 Tax=Streptomyces polyrhachis TaxID=1282885 RepID=A0ABW2GBG2_9ACTN